MLDYTLVHEDREGFRYYVDNTKLPDIDRWSNDIDGGWQEFNLFHQIIGGEIPSRDFNRDLELLSPWASQNFEEYKTAVCLF